MSIQVTFNRVATARRSPAKTFHSPPRRSAPIVRSTNRVSLIACARAGLTTRGRRRKLLRSLRFGAAKTRARSRSQPLARSSVLVQIGCSLRISINSSILLRLLCCVASRAEDKHRHRTPSARTAPSAPSTPGGALRRRAPASRARIHFAAP